MSLPHASRTFEPLKREEVMRKPRIAVAALIGTFVLVSLSPSAKAMPMFARKLKVGCSACHTIIPRLNATGFEFRAAGFRTASDIGKPETIDYSAAFGDYDSLRLQLRYDLADVKIDGTSTSNNKLTFEEITFYPLTGSFLKNFSSLFEISLVPGDPLEVENAYGRGDWWAGPGYISVRAGIFHPFEGFGASDRPITITRPFIQNTPANFNQSTFFTPWGFDEVGIELGYTYKNTSLRATVFNGLNYSIEEGHATPATHLTGSDSKTPGRPSYNSKDVQIFFNQILTENGGGISAYYYIGRIDLPIAGTEDQSFFKDIFDRWAVYAGYPIGGFFPIGGYQQGTDDTFLAATGDYGPTTTTKGWFAELDYYFDNRVGLAARYDWDDPSDLRENNNIKGGTFAVNVPFENGLQAIAQYQYKETDRGTQPKRIDNAFQIRAIWIW
jgi:hypothetical protein